MGRPATGPAPLGAALLRQEFPTVAIHVDERAGASAPRATVDLTQWSDRRRPFEPFDAAVEAVACSKDPTVVVCGAPELAFQAALEVMTRSQWLIGRRNAASSGPELTALLSRLEALHDVGKPLVRADYVHALDTWQWALRLDPSAGLSLQMAALLHDVERLESEPDERVEHLAPDYRGFKAKHARRGADMARAIIESCGASGATRDRAAALVEGHETPGT
ncbi:MAG: DUF4202 domain-containing protein, partial [Polyangiaceae bacterium]|nr:DUF4202 domain-containing protein [Polyangiaceae bacterium]